MKRLTASLLTLPLLACAAKTPQASAQTSKVTESGSSVRDDAAMEISRSATRPPAPGPADWFTGPVTITPLFDAKGQSQVGAAVVRFEPGSRTAWHKHPLGQRLVVLEGTGWTQVEGSPIETIHAGDVIWCPPDQRHWHGATLETTMAHIAIQESENGSPVEWMEQVPDQLHRTGPG